MPQEYNQKLSFSNRKEEIVEEFNFNGGLVTDPHETKLAPGQSPNVYNVLFNTTGSVKTRDGYSRYNASPIGAAADQSNTGASTGSLAIDATTDYVAQTFIPSGSVSVTQVDLYLAMQTANQEQYVQVEIWATSAGLPTTLMLNGTGQIRLVTGTSETAYSFLFRNPVVLTTAVTYAVVIKPFVRGSAQTVNQVNVYHRGATYANGSVATSVNTGSSWTADTAKDLRFVVYSGGNTPITGLMRYYNSTGTQQLLAKVGTSLYRGDDVTGATTAITFASGVALNTSNFLDYLIVNDTLLVVDKDSQIKKYRGSTNANYSTGTITATLGSATVTGSGTSWSTSTNAAVGEYIQLPDSKWYKITAIASNTSLTIERTYLPSTSSGASYVISPWGEVNGQLGTATVSASLTVPTPDFIENYSNRIWTLTNNTLNFSVLDTSVTEEHFNDWDTSNNSGIINIPAGKGDTGTGLYALGNALFVFQRHAIWAVYGNSPANFELRNITNEIGMVDKRTLVEWGDTITFLSDKGVYMFDGSNLKNISDGVVNSTIESWANKTSAVATLWQNSYIIGYTPGGGAANTEALYYDYTRNVWGRTDGAYMNVFSNWIGGTDNGEVYFGSSTTGNVYRWDSGSHDDGYEIYTLYDTPSLGFGAGINDKAIKKFFIQQLALGDWDMTVTQLLNIGEVITAGSAITVTPGTSSLWDVAQWDVEVWSSEGALVTTRIAEFQGIGKYYKFRFEQTGYAEGVEILGILGTARMRRLQ